MSTYTQNPDNTYIFGVEAAGVTINGTLLSGSTGYASQAGAQLNADKHEQRDENGNVIATTKYNRNGDVTVNFALRIGAEIPDIDDILTVGAYTGTMDSVSVQYQNTGSCDVSCTAHWYEGIVIPS